MENPTQHLDPQYLERIRHLRELGAAYANVPAAAKRPSDAAAGQIWSTQPSSISQYSSAETPVWILLLKKLAGQVRGRHLFEAAPLFPDVEMAGPHDALIPAGIVGFHCAVALGTRLTVLQDSLAEFQATAPTTLMKGLHSFCARKTKAEASAPLAVYTGAPYLGPSDIRIRFHEELAQRLDYLWAPLALALDTTSIDFGKNLPSSGVIPAAWEVFESEMAAQPVPSTLTSQVGPPVVQPKDPRLRYQAREAALFDAIGAHAETFSPGILTEFVPLRTIRESIAVQELDIAADTGDTGDTPFVRDIFEVPAYSVFVRAYLASDAPNIVFVVHDSAGDPSGALDGISVVAKDGGILACIQKGSASVPLSTPLPDVGLRLATGEPLLWRASTRA